jgi:hypothetical protein
LPAKGRSLLKVHPAEVERQLFFAALGETAAVSQSGDGAANVGHRQALAAIAVALAAAAAVQRPYEIQARSASSLASAGP